ncbi:MAG: TonB-dependent receptor [Opitutus sp.]
MHPSTRSGTSNLGLRPAVTLLFCICSLAPRLTAAEQVRRSFAIPASDAERTLVAFAQQAGTQIVYILRDVRGVETNTLKGDFSIGEALQRLVANTALEVVHDEKTDTYVVRRSRKVSPPAKVSTTPTQAPQKMNISRRNLVSALLSLLSIHSIPAQTASPTKASEEAEIVLSPFQVNATRDSGYVATSSLVATGFSQEIYKTPINISVVTSEFIKDRNLTNLDQVADYLSGVSARVNGSGNQGDGAQFSIRGFSTLWNTRDGIRRYSFAGGLENVDRVEAIKGPLSVFFGQQAPGGLLNYVTKRPSFASVNDISVRFGSYDEKYASFGSQGAINEGKTLAYRVFASNTDRGDWRDFTFEKKKFFYAGLLFQPVKELQIYLEYEKVRQEFNGAGLLPQGSRQYLNEWQNPTSAAKSWAIANGIGSNPNDNPASAPNTVATSANVVDVLRDRWRRDSGRWADDIGSVTGTRPETLVETLVDLYPAGRKWNIGGRNGTVNNDSDTRTVEVNYKITDMFSFRGFHMQDNIQRWGYSSWRDQPNGDGTYSPVQNGGFNPNNSRITRLELLTRFEIGETRHNIITGVEEYYDEWRPVGSWLGNPERTVPDSQVPFAQGYTGGAPRPTSLTGYLDKGWDPRKTPTFDGLKYYENGVLPHYANDEFVRVQENTRRAVYANWTGSFFKDKLTTLAGIRRETFKNGWAFTDGRPDEPDLNTKSTIPTMGAVYEFKEGFTAYASYSRSYEPNWDGRVDGAGTTEAERKEVKKPNEGSGIDFGVKASTKDGKISGALSFYEVKRASGYVENEALTRADPRNKDADNTNNVSIRGFGGTIVGRGVELDTVFNPTTNYSFTLSLSYMPTAELTKASNPGELNKVGLRVQSAPEKQYSTWHRYSFTEGSFKGVSLGFGVRGVSERNKSNNFNERGLKVKGYTLADAMIRYQTAGFRNFPVFLTLNVSNLFDNKDYFTTWDFPGDPRKWSLSTDIKF